MKTIQITIDEPTLEELDRALGEIGESRSAYMRNLVRKALKERRIKELERQQAEGYRRFPVQPGEFDMPEEDLDIGDDWPWEDA